jgi:hypothetical protein
MVGSGESSDSGRRCVEAFSRICGSEGEVRAEPKWEKRGGGSVVAALTSERGHRQWRGQIPSEGRCSDGGGSRKSNGEGGFAHGVLRM